MSTHEPAAAQTEAPMGSDRSFGIVFTVVFAVIGLWPFTSGREPLVPALAAAVALLVVALAYPRALRPLNLLWFKFGMLLHHVVTPVVMGLLFFLVLTPVSLVMRVLGRHPKIFGPAPKGVPTYWIARTPPGPAPETMKNQF